MAVFQRGRFGMYMYGISLFEQTLQAYKNHAFNKRVMILYYVSQYKASEK